MSTSDEGIETMPCDRCGQPHARCSAHTRAGNPCTQRPMAGQRVCRMHGGSSPKAIAAAAGRQQEAEAGRVLAKIWNKDAAPVTNAVQGLQQLAGQLQHAADALGQRIEDGLDPVTAAAWLRVLRELRTALSEMERLGIAERHAEIEAAKVRLMAMAASRLLERLEVDPVRRVVELRLFMGDLRSLPAPEVPDGGGEAA